MGEISAIPWNGFTAASTFSGTGGSSLGYRMAGFRVAWASEFIEAARDSYRANAAPYTVLDGRDIREVTAGQVLDALGMQPGELDLLDGSPPCASFSTAGKRQAGWGQVKKYSDSSQRTDDLFYEYARLVEGIQPRVFVAENVAGLVKGSAKGYFIRILARLRACGYRVEARLLDAQWLGVPQARQRLIFVGVREDLGLAPAFPTPLPYRYTVADALPWIAAYGTAPPHADYLATDRDMLTTARPAAAGPSPTVMASGLNKGAGMVIARVVHDTSGQRSAGDITDRPAPTVTVGVNAVNSHHFQVHSAAAGGESTDVDPETGKNIMIDRYAIGEEWARLPPGGESQRYLNLKRASRDRPLRTVTAQGGNVGAAGVTHWAECRKLTLGELRALCGFPAGFVLTGTYEQRWERLGRAVPPVMMSHIAAAVRDDVLVPAREA